MRKIVIIPDSFKGTLSSKDACGIMSDAARNIFPNAEIVAIPIADGGEGTVDAVLAAVGGEKIRVSVAGPHFGKVDSFYGLLPDGTAVIEMAAAAGLPLMDSRASVGTATTFGVGELIRHALGRGARRIVLGLGGSATNDGGCGAAAALGAVFRNADGSAFVPTGETLGRIASVDVTETQKILGGIPVEAMCDVDSPLCGETGAAFVFAPQKGADERMVRLLDDGLRHLAGVIARDLGKSVDVPGAGAAGGMGAGLIAFLNARLLRGIDAMLGLTHFDEILRGADIVFTGEGRFDSQSLMGKAVGGIAERAKKAGVPAVCVAGAVDVDMKAAYHAGIVAAFSINRKPMPLEEAARHTRENLAATMESIFRLL